MRIINAGQSVAEKRSLHVIHFSSLLNLHVFSVMWWIEFLNTAASTLKLITFYNDLSLVTIQETFHKKTTTVRCCFFTKWQNWSCCKTTAGKREVMCMGWIQTASAPLRDKMLTPCRVTAWEAEAWRVGHMTALQGADSLPYRPQSWCSWLGSITSAPPAYL